ncbi:MAG: hypothetical protein KatS3mg057_2468 [Herpetosiphonaceae bacterium]|nr:MAG: hypothetical protein KatS3mg057_2468 [Herpetosiphonaceae bacterium]
MAAAIYWRNPELEREINQALSDVARNGSGDPFVLLGTIDGPLNAEIARGILEQEGIEVILRPNTLGAVYGLTVGSFGVVRLYVRASQVERAHQILSELAFSSGETTGSPPADT